MTAAGGTTLEPASTSGVQSVRGFTEIAWSRRGLRLQPRGEPAGLSDRHRGCTGRSYADISADADPEHGHAGLRLRRRRLGRRRRDERGLAADRGLLRARSASAATAQGPSWAYANAALLNDPTTGSNGSCLASISYICNAGPGYDGPTGVGSISGAVAAGRPASRGPGTNGSYAQTVTAGSAQLQGGVYPNGADTDLLVGVRHDHRATASRPPPNDIGSGTDAGAGHRHALAACRPGRPTTTGWSRRTASAPSTATTTRSLPRPRRRAHPARARTRTRRRQLRRRRRPRPRRAARR